MRFDVLTLFPHALNAILGESIIGRAQEKGLINLHFHNIRDFSLDKHRRVDDYPYGGGHGMIMQCQPIFTAIEMLKKEIGFKPYTLLMSPQGKTFNQEMAKNYSELDNLAIICGHYEGIDERVVNALVDEEVSIGDFILTGGEIPAMAIIDAVSRLIPNVLKHKESHEEESFTRNILEYPQYTRPSEFMGMEVPDVLLSGNHENIRLWRMYQSIKRTYKRRPELIEQSPLSIEEREILSKIKKEES